MHTTDQTDITRSMQRVQLLWMKRVGVLCENVCLPCWSSVAGLSLDTRIAGDAIGTGFSRVSRWSVNKSLLHVMGLLSLPCHSSRSVKVKS